MSKPLFSKKIKCSHCGKNFKAKLEKGKRKYVCSSYDNYGKCVRNVIEEDWFRDLIEKRYRKEELTNEEIRERVDWIEFENKWKFVIHLKNDKNIIYGDNFIQY
ncbi:zinc ribbon domain-containing protein [Lederbergia lenta]|uniref:zinc ribbon domain-containing protein n=1 Tax=Lederbergia lenta TaxID=1467 RepID=UPI0020423E8D|nr:zinc ribbon domain-containing protein [Lederbergia lenta]MCM3110061.1 zinc ribbon domain-containing protein [Lederbergia lenta]